ncbi:hypothetical protein G7Y89_g10677 [Cudoniella acicularis]|uniref:Digeranylgeranylglyceryl phosphate synthase n=1 Tax=Cudoniella acicularis TaxID=354080 RepID=A0A8H4REL6_9HELO|nr:hypothetical protein G7Y89_g10677 [Cudoniella acicularis]
MVYLSARKYGIPALVEDLTVRIGSLFFHLYSIWLFTFSDLKTIVCPMALFGTVNALSTLAFGVDQNTVPTDIEILCRIPRVAFWIWINLLPFAIDNQRQPSAILEDGVNKPWRPMPAKRLSPERAKVWMLILYPLAVLISNSFGALRQCLALVCLGVWYNDLEGADTNCFVRNFINACGFISYASGAMEVAFSRPLPVSTTVVSWFAVIAAMVMTSVHSQDMPDQEGDKLRGRKSVPLTIGDEPSRWIIAVSVSAFSFFCPWFWDSVPGVYACLAILGATVSVRSLFCRSVPQDKTTFLLWNLWVAVIYCLPFVKKWSISLGGL